MTFTLFSPPRIIAGGGAVAEIPGLLHRLGVKRPLVVTDPFLATSPLFVRLTAPMKAAGVHHAVFQSVTGEPTTTVVDACRQLLEAGDFDGLVGFGGGSPLDTAKAAAILYAGGGAMRDWKAPREADVARLPLICVPTTAGTGSEVTRFTVVTDVDTNPEEKMLILGAACVPDVAVVDYELTLDLPPRITADTGLDALTHALEAYVSVKANPQSDALALSALDLIARHIRTAYQMPEDRAAREAMMFGATQAGLAFSYASVALVHGMSRPIGAFFHVPHGLSNAMLLPEVTRYSVPGAPERYARAARAMGVAQTGDDSDTACEKLITYLSELNRALDVPTPRAHGIDGDRWEELLPTMAQQALASGSPANNPRVPDPDTMVEIYRRAFG